MIYYVQKAPRSYRRYSDGVAERWDVGERKWTESQCAPERCCLRTDDEILTEAEFKKKYAEISQG